MRILLLAIIASLICQSCLVLRNNKPESYCTEAGKCYTITRVKEGKKLMLYNMVLPDSTAYEFLTRQECIKALNHDGKLY